MQEECIFLPRSKTEIEEEKIILQSNILTLRLLQVVEVTCLGFQEICGDVFKCGEDKIFPVWARKEEEGSKWVNYENLHPMIFPFWPCILDYLLKSILLLIWLCQAYSNRHHPWDISLSLYANTPFKKTHHFVNFLNFASHFGCLMRIFHICVTTWRSWEKPAIHFCW